MKSVYLLRPISEDAKEWVEENVQYESWNKLGGAIGIEHGFIAPIVEGMVAAGLVEGEDFEVE